MGAFAIGAEVLVVVPFLLPFFGRSNCGGADGAVVDVVVLVVLPFFLPFFLPFCGRGRSS